MTYAEYKHRDEMASNKRLVDARDAALHAQFDLGAQDLHHKHDRAHFVVGGEGSMTAQENFRRNYERIFPACRPGARGFHPSGAARPGVGAAG